MARILKKALSTALVAIVIVWVALGVAVTGVPHQFLSKDGEPGCYYHLVENDCGERDLYRHLGKLAPDDYEAVRGSIALIAKSYGSRYAETVADAVGPESGACARDATMSTLKHLYTSASRLRTIAIVLGPFAALVPRTMPITKASTNAGYPVFELAETALDAQVIEQSMVEIVACIGSVG